ncbi:MAG: hypothetical protein K2Y10_05240 [Burkholderiaceae bacterium]|nr:hypothetical protein [Burkholderiaceae bacterium]
MSKTHEQEVVLAKTKVAELKHTYMESLKEFIGRDKKDKNRCNELFLDLQKNGNSYFNYIEEFVGNSDLLGAHENGRWVIGFAEDCLAALDSLISHIMLLRAFTREENPTLLEAIEPVDTAYANMQRMVVQYLTKAQSGEIEKKLKSKSLPIYGFENPNLPIMNRKVQTILSFGFGIVFVITILVVAIFIPTPTDFQYTIFRIVLSLAAGGVVAAFPGFIEVSFGKWLRAGGALAVFALVYFAAPAAIENQSTILPKTGLNELSSIVGTKGPGSIFH